jgi:hypothetical protein
MGKEAAAVLFVGGQEKHRDLLHIYVKAGLLLWNALIWNFEQ